jgi:hypothetical protein
MMAASLPTIIIFPVPVWQVEALQFAEAKGEGGVWSQYELFNLSILGSTLALRFNPSILIQSRFYGSIPVSWFIPSFKVQVS